MKLSDEDLQLILKSKIIARLSDEFKLKRIDHYSIAGSVANLANFLYRNENASGKQLMSNLRLGRVTLWKHFKVLSPESVHSMLIWRREIIIFPVE